MIANSAMDLENRTRVWILLSDFFLDDDSAASYADVIARNLAASPYSTEELNSIMYEEVAPALIFNLQSPAGQWGAFDKTWLIERILNFPKREAEIPGWKKVVYSVLNPLHPSAGGVDDSLFRTSWIKVLDIVTAIRADNEQQK